MDQPIAKISKLDIVRGDFNLHFVRAAMVYVFGYQKCFDYEAHPLIPFIGHGPPIFWLYPAFGIRGAAFFLGSPRWVIGTLLLLGFWNRRLAVPGSLGSCATYVATVTIILFFPDAWAASAGGSPAPTLPFLLFVRTSSYWPHPSICSNKTFCVRAPPHECLSWNRSTRSDAMSSRFIRGKADPRGEN